MKGAWGWTFLVIGIFVTLTGYATETTVCDNQYFKSVCTHNIGLLNDKTNQINTGGFITLAGVILLATDTQKSTVKQRQSDQIDKDKQAKALFDQKQKGYVRHTCPRCSYTVGVISHDGKYWTCDKCDKKTKLL